MKNKSIFIKEQNYLDELYEKVLDILTDQLNTFHEVKFEKKGWRNLIGWWLLNYIPALYYKYKSISEISQLNKVYTYGLLKDQYYHVIDTKDYLDKIMRSDLYNLQQYTKVCESLNIEIHHLNGLDKIPIEKNKVDCRYRLTKNNIIKKILDFLAYRSKVYIYNVPFRYDESLRLSVKTLGKIGFSFSQPKYCVNETFDETFRKRLDFTSYATNNFEKFLFFNIPMDMPIIYMEGFNSLKALALKRFGEHHKHVLSCSGWYDDDLFKMYIAMNRKEIILRGIQHGGMGDIWKHNVSYDVRNLDIYYTWGWKRNMIGCKTIPMPSLKLLSEVKKKNFSKRILFVTTAEPRFFYRCDLPERTNMWRYFCSHVDFFKELNKEIYDDLVVRTYKEDYGWEITNIYKKFGFKPTLDKTGISFVDSVSDCCLYISDMISTTWAEAYHIGVPIIMFSLPEFEAYSLEANVFIRELREVGIYQASPQAAAELINQIYPDFELWWSDPKRKAAMDKFAKEYAYCSDDGLVKWKQELKKLGGL